MDRSPFRPPPFRALLLLCLLTAAGCGDPATTSTEDASVTPLSLTDPERIATVDERFQSYNIEMAEVVGGDFWIPYADMDTTQAASLPGEGLGQNKNRYRYRPPIDLSNARLRKLAAALSPAVVRFSGSWANYVYFQDDDGAKLAEAPEGFRYVLSRPEWAGVIDFVRATDSDLMTSFAISAGARDADGRWTPDQARALVDYTKELGGTFDVVQFFNEPNMPEYAGAPKGYTAADFAADVEQFNAFVDAELPGVPVAGPDAVGEGGLLTGDAFRLPLSTDQLLAAEPKPDFDIFAYHHYGGVSRRCATEPPLHSPVDSALTATWLNKTLKTYEFYRERRDEYLPGKPIWLAETAEAACGGNPWAAEFIDVFRYLSQMGKLAKKDVKVIMHNTLTASDYGILDQDTHKPRPNYWAALLWRQLMGTEVYDAGTPTGEAGFYLHSNRRDPAAKTLLVVNPTAEAVRFSLPAAAERYALSANGLRTKVVLLNGEPLTLTAEDELPPLTGDPVAAGATQVAGHSVSFFTF